MSVLFFFMEDRFWPDPEIRCNAAKRAVSGVERTLATIVEARRSTQRRRLIPTLDCQELATLSSSKPRRDPLAYLVTERAHRIVGAVHISARHRKVLVPQ